MRFCWCLTTFSKSLRLCFCNATVSLAFCKNAQCSPFTKWKQETLSSLNVHNRKLKRQNVLCRFADTKLIKLDQSPCNVLHLKLILICTKTLNLDYSSKKQNKKPTFLCCKIKPIAIKCFQIYLLCNYYLSSIACWYI